MEFSKQDWALFREKISAWQEAYMDRLSQEYMSILSGDGNPSDKFWLLEKRINQDKKCRGVVIQMRQQNLAFDLAALINDGVITFCDIQEFSDELKDAVKHLCNTHLSKKTEYISQRRSKRKRVGPILVHPA